MIPGNTTIKGINNFNEDPNNITFCPYDKLFAPSVRWAINRFNPQKKQRSRAFWNDSGVKQYVIFHLTVQQIYHIPQLFERQET